GEQNPPAQVRDAEDIQKLLKHGWMLSFYACAGARPCTSASPYRAAFLVSLPLGFAATSPPITTALPPAFSIFSCADFENLWACTVTAIFSSPSPSTLMSPSRLFT